MIYRFIYLAKVIYNIGAIGVNTCNIRVIISITESDYDRWSVNFLEAFFIHIVLKLMHLQIQDNNNLLWFFHPML